MNHPVSEKSNAHRSTTEPLRIAILSSGRFHVLDLARELVRLGHDFRFYWPGRARRGLHQWLLTEPNPISQPSNEAY